MRKKQTQEIKRRSVQGVIVAGLVQGVSLVGGFILSIYLSPEIFGVFIVVAATAAFLSYFSDIGLAAALIQKKEKVTDKDLTTTFTIQQILVVILVIISLLAAPWVGELRDFSSDGVWLFRALVFAFFLSSLKTIPSVLLERDLRFRELAIPQILEVITFNVIIIYLALQGWGISMFAVAVLARGAVGLISIYMIRPWIPKIWIYTESARKLISFGIPFQLNSLLGLAKDQLFVMFLPVILPIAEVGYIGWAKKWSEVPLRLIMDNVVRVTFPTYARLQHFPEKLSKGVNKTAFFLMLFVIPMSVGMIFVVEPLISLIPEYSKWEPALLSFYLFVISAAVAGVSTPLINALNAIGKIKISLYFMAFWTVFTWTVAPLLVLVVGFNAIAITSALMSLGVIAVVYIAKRHIRISLIAQIMPAVVSSIVMALVLYVLKSFFISSYIHIVLYIIIGGMVYMGTLMLFFRKRIVEEVVYIAQSVRSSL